MPVTHMFVALAGMVAVGQFAARQTDPDAALYHRLSQWSAIVWLAGAALLAMLAPELVGLWARVGLVVAVGEAAPAAFQSATLSGRSPALVVVWSFAAVIALGSSMLMTPRATAVRGGAPPAVAVFTAVSAVTVTGLTVVDTGTYWSGFGQAVILVLIQIGGVGVMTVGAFLSVILGRGLLVREAALMGNLVESRGLADVGRLLLGVVLFTVVAELAGALLLWQAGAAAWQAGTTTPPAFTVAFHAVSAFCNAGFSIRPGGLDGLALTWGVGLVIPALVIVGGLGYGVVANLARMAGYHLSRWLYQQRPRWFAAPRRDPQGWPPDRPRLELTSRLALIVTALLLGVGTLGVFALETLAAPAPHADAPHGWLARQTENLAHAWFVSVNARTAGFALAAWDGTGEATRFFLILLMFVGGSPGSTAGGVKTVALAVTVLTLIAVLADRDRVECGHRTIPDVQVRRALLVVLLAASVGAIATLGVCTIEGAAARGRFIDVAFEVVSALSTVGLSSYGTERLSLPSQGVIMALMFLGRVGPLTLMLALAGRVAHERYRFPDERVMLG